MKKVYKYQVGSGHITIQKRAKIVHVDFQSDVLCIWAEVDINEELEAHYYFIVGTGHEIEENAIHIHTWFDGPFVFHLYKRA
jgi:hypothetical protein